MTIFRYSSSSRIARIEERFATIYMGGNGKDAVTRQESLGWWVVTEPPNPLAMQAGPEKPEFTVGAHVDVVLEVKT